MPVITIEKPLKQVLGDDGSDSLIRLLNQIQKEQKEDILEFVEEKFERRLTKEISGLRGEIKEEIANVRVDMHRIQSYLIKWMFIFLVGQFSAIMGSLFLFFK